MKGEHGFALVAVLLVMAMLGALGAEFAYAMRLEATEVRSYRDGIVAEHLAEAGIAQAIREIVGDVGFVAVADDGDLTFYKADRSALPRLPRTNVPLGAGAFSYRISDEEGRINVNSAPPPRIDALLTVLGIDKIARDTIGDSLQDWRDADEAHRVNGAESEDTYLLLSVPYRSKNGALDSLEELRQVHGVTREIFEGTQERPGIKELLSVRSPGQVNINTASPVVLRALGLGDAQLSDVVQGRKQTPMQMTDLGRFPQGVFQVQTRTFRIVAEGLVEGHVRARVTAIVQRHADTGGDNVTVLEWAESR